MSAEQMPSSVQKTSRGATGGLTLRILAVNVIAPLVLVLGILYLSQYRESLIRAELETLKAQARLYASAIAEASLAFNIKNDVNAPPSIDLMKRIGATINSRALLFSAEGELVAENINPGEWEQRLAALNMSQLALVVRTVGHALLKMLPTKTPLQPYPGHEARSADFYPSIKAALDGEVGATPWEAPNGDVILTTSAPIIVDGKIIGVLHLTRGGVEIERALALVRFDVFTVFLGTLSLTIFMSIYLAGFIGRPLKKLAMAAEAVRQGKGRQIEIPDFSSRRDEIGDLSVSFRDMTQALWDRMDTIERFAADVAHEIKNPLTSLRSAVETVDKVKSEESRQRLMEVIQNDVHRLDRLISDISNASRLDAELSRDEMGAVDLVQLLSQLIAARRDLRLNEEETTSSRSQVTIEFDVQDAHENAFVRGNESRLAQVFDNLLSNAVSFSPVSGVVNVVLDQSKSHIGVYVEDGGPGIPENKLETIFERFYTERPEHEQENVNDFGTHSGLGLAIAKQIIVAHGGSIFAENIHDENDRVTGARFTVLLNRF